MLKKLKNISWGYLLLGILLAAIGLAFVLLKDTFAYLALTVGIIVTLSGILVGVRALVNDKRGVGFVLTLSLAVALIISGVISIIARDSAVAVIANVFFLLITVDGSFKLEKALVGREYRSVTWWIMLVSSLTLIILSFLLAKLTPEKTDTLSVLTGLIILFDGVVNALSAFFVKYGQENIDTPSLPDDDNDTPEVKND